jgi:hypothetical protein
LLGTGPLYGLVSLIDEFTFDDLRSFKSQFARLNSPDDYRALRERIRPICQRSLRRQVQPYISCLAQVRGGHGPRP